jgi:hypothetical protein
MKAVLYDSAVITYLTRKMRGELEEVGTKVGGIVERVCEGIILFLILNIDLRGTCS